MSIWVRIFSKAKHNPKQLKIYRKTFINEYLIKTEKFRLDTTLKKGLLVKNIIPPRTSHRPLSC